MNCIQPMAPALEGPVFAPQLLSTSLIAARTCHGTLYCVAAAWKIGSRKYGPGKSWAAVPGNGGGASGVSAFQSTETGGKYICAGAWWRFAARRWWARLTPPLAWRGLADTRRCSPDGASAARETPTGAAGLPAGAPRGGRGGGPAPLAAPGGAGGVGGGGGGGRRGARGGGGGRGGGGWGRRAPPVPPARPPDTHRRRLALSRSDRRAACRSRRRHRPAAR